MSDEILEDQEPIDESTVLLYLCEEHPSGGVVFRRHPRPESAQNLLSLSQILAYVEERLPKDGKRVLLGNNV